MHDRLLTDSILLTLMPTTVIVPVRSTLRQQDSGWPPAPFCLLPPRMAPQRGADTPALHSQPCPEGAASAPRCHHTPTPAHGGALRGAR